MADSDVKERWVCPSCGFENGEIRVTCLRCPYDKDRPEAENPARQPWSDNRVVVVISCIVFGFYAIVTLGLNCGWTLNCPQFYEAIGEILVELTCGGLFFGVPWVLNAVRKKLAQ